MVKLTLTEDDCKCFVQDLVMVIGEKLGIDYTDKTVDTGLIYCSPSVKEAIKSNYFRFYGTSQIGVARRAFQNDWDEYGPYDDPEIDGYTVELEDGWCE